MSPPAPEIIIPYGAAPEPHEIEVARILTQHFLKSVRFIAPSRGFKMKTADIEIGAVRWEIKSPTGASKRSTVERQFKGLKQSANLVIDGRRTPLTDQFMLSQINKEIQKHRRAKKILYITKSKDIIACMRQ